MAYAIPSEEERPILFRWLKQQSSFTIWTKIDGYYSAWVEEFKRIAPLAIDSEDGQPSLNESDTRLLLTSRAAFVDALGKLRRGDRSVFKWFGYGTGQGYFCEAWRVVGAWQTSRGRIQEGLPLADTEYWPAFELRLDALVSAWGAGKEALQVRHTDLPAPIADMRDLRGTYFVPSYLPPPNDKPIADPVFVRLLECAAELPSVPTPADEILVPTGNEIPCYGIWEPVKLDLSPGFAGLFRKPLVPPDGKFELDGCMNYLHAGSPAPTIGFEEDDFRGEGRPTVWRLLWRDDRYLDGSIPDEEKAYIFVHPPQLKAPEAAARSVADDLIVASSGALAAVGGSWAARDHLGVRVRIRKGEPLPRHLGRDIEWVFVEGL